LYERERPCTQLYLPSLIVSHYFLQIDAKRKQRGQSEYGSAEDTEETALHMAINGTQPEHDEIAALLIKRGADVNIVRKFLLNERI
jgi:Ankyrin repeat